MNTKKTILIFGTGGLLGSALMRLFQKRGMEIVAMHRVDLDVTDPAAVTAALDQIRPHTIINATAINTVDAIEENPEVHATAILVNTNAPGTLARLAQERGMVLVHYSTDYVFDGRTSSPYIETDVPNPINMYGQTKYDGELAVQKNTDAYYVIRTSWLYGHTTGNNRSKRTFVDIMLGLAETRDRLQVVSDQCSVPTHADDVAQFTYKLLEKPYPFGIYHGINRGQASRYEWAEEIFRLKNISITLEPVPAFHFPRAAQAPLYTLLQNTKGPKMREWKEALAEFLLTDN